MKATVRVLISVLALVVAGAVTAPAASGLSPATPNVAAVQAEPDAGAVVSVTPARVADSRAGLQIPGAVAGFGTVGVQVAERIRAGIAGLDAAAGHGVTVSVGVACAPDDATTRDGLVAAADVALYRAKALGGDGLAVAEAAIAPTPEPAEATARS